ncbi:hypothetical protein F4813DRAFT_366597 [Daldinia decipiens]|uniref:uncharacterized protein n=1 Tax=Daldinia decipiens TaxID=326647 RepID=UPI0020C492F5|nr:uncharacterized protein F4813DRAFT_366597 [Daldinia decipiens]KAI1655597.1 hypothetical protein F4813DRAFT_366597 [Daldinia decipiens]
MPIFQAFFLSLSSYHPASLYYPTAFPNSYFANLPPCSLLIHLTRHPASILFHHHLLQYSTGHTSISTKENYIHEKKSGRAIPHSGSGKKRAGKVLKEKY